MKFLAPQRLRPAYYEGIEAALNRHFYTIIFKPLISIIKSSSVQKVMLNASIKKIDAALRTGKIQYSDGIFSGQYNAAIGKEMRDLGAEYDHRSNVYRIDPKLIPEELQTSIAHSQAKAQEAHDKIKKELDTIEGSTATEIKVPGDFMVNKVYSDFQTAAKAAMVTPSLSDAHKKLLADDYNSNMKLYIKDWTKEQIKRLRTAVDTNSTEGGRFDNLIQRIQEQYAVSQSKAKFLARQETALFMSKFRKERFDEAGVRVYKWSARSPSLTRPDHWRLNGHFFQYNDPPVVDLASGRRGNPGEDFGCLCVDIPALGYLGKIGV